MIFHEDVFWIAAVALIIDGLIGDPDWLWRRLPHPIVLMGGAIDWFEARFNHSRWSEWTRRCLGGLMIFVMVLLVGVMGWFFESLSMFYAVLVVVDVVVVVILVAQRSLYNHVQAVVRGIADKGLVGGRAAVAMIVGRDPQRLDEAGVSRAAIESTAENFSDGVVAPIFWYIVGGLPGIFIFKLINTADSMIGHKTERYRAFGWVAARVDDIVCFVPSRLAGALIASGAALCGGSMMQAVCAMTSDAHLHRSPNAGWPEAAMGGALGVALAGPRTYHGEAINDAWMHRTGRRAVSTNDIRRSLRVFVAACAVQCALVLMAAVVVGHATI